MGKIIAVRGINLRKVKTGNKIMNTINPNNKCQIRHKHKKESA